MPDVVWVEKVYANNFREYIYACDSKQLDDNDQKYHADHIVQSLIEALDKAKNGIQWWIDTFPNEDIRADQEMLDEIEKVLKKARGENNG
jgi:creatinine amidohydrolase/Fe(II)-dependent formamide hydrolase-like protein